MNIRKKVLSAVLAAALAFGSAVYPTAANLSIIAQADEVYNSEALMTADRLFKYSINNDSVIITRYCGNSSEVIIPDEIDGKPVTQIGSNAFSACDSLESVTISANVTSMESPREFENNKLIKAINVDETNTAFSSVDGVLLNKDKTELIHYPRGKTDISYKIPDSVTKLGNRAFFGCESLESITISDSVAEMGYYVFLGCSSLEAINITEANSHFSFADGALFNKDKTELIWYLVGEKNVSYKIPDSVTKIGDDAFYCDYFKTLILPESVTEIGINAFPGDSLENINVNEANSCFTSVDGILFNKDKTEIIRYPSGKNESSYKIPNGVESIITYAFRRTALESIVIPDSVTRIEIMAVYNCSSLTKVIFTGSEKEWEQVLVADDAFFKVNAEIVFEKETGDPNDTSSDTSDDTSSKIEYTPEPVTDETVDEDTKKVIAEIKVIAPEMAFEVGTILTVKKDDAASGDKAYALDITFTLNGAPVQPKDGKTVTVQIPVPPILKNADESLLKVFHFFDGKYTKVEATVENGMVKFDTTHFSTYVISTEDLAGTNDGSSGTGSKPSSDGNPSTGIAIALVPTILAGAAVTVIIRKRK